MVKSVYIHIPFCNHICHYCDFPKMLYQEKWIDSYLNALDLEMKMYYQNETIETIYIGGGTPTALKLEEFHRLLEIIDQLKKEEHYEYTIECNVESLTEEKIKIMKEYGVNRISIGVETFHAHHLKKINRMHTKEQVMKAIQLLKKYGFKNINIDLIYALPNETIEEVTSDLEVFLSLDIPHISTYSLIIEPNTTLYLQKQEPMQEDLDVEMYEYICKTLKIHGYEHYEISNFAKPGYESTHNITYWNNEEYYGFGLGASGYVNNIRYTNTKSLTNYCAGKYQFEQEKLDQRTSMENEMILGLRKRKGVNRNQFLEKYGKTIESVFPIHTLQKEGKLQILGDWISIPEDQIYLSNDILMQFIDDD